MHSTSLSNFHFAVQGFDEYMNLVLDEAEEVSMKRKTRKPLGAWQCSEAALAVPTFSPVNCPFAVHSRVHTCTCVTMRLRRQVCPTLTLQ